MALIRSFATVGGYTALSRVLGFVREILIAYFVGTGMVADAFFVAFRLPNLFRRVFAEGAFNAAFVPLFAGRLEAGGETAAKAFAEQALAVLLTSLLALTAAAMAAMPWIIYLLAPGFAADSDKFQLTVELSQITFPYLLFIALAALLGGVLNSLYRFAAAAAAPVLLNIFFIAALAVVVPLTGAPGQVMAWTVAAAGVGQFLLLQTAAARAGMSLRLPRPRLTPGVRRLLRLMVPGLLSAGAMQVNLMVATIIASFQAGAVSYLYFADRIYQLPLGLIGIGLGVVLLPDLTRKIRGRDDAAASRSLNRGLELAVLLTLPAALALVVIPLPIVVVLFERGAFDRTAVDATAAALAAFGLGLPSFVLVKVLQPGFFAREDTKTPFKVTVISVIANIALGLALFWPLKHIGLALATSLAMWLNTAMLALGLRRRGFFALDQRCRARLPRIALANLLMAVGLWLAQRLLSGWFEADLLSRIAGLLLLIGEGLVVYGAGVLLFGAVRIDEIRASLRRA
ncbi:MAG TPA: murein biosynthesis integral membrane protein MurJ [Kiloniellales bacterium]